MFVKVLMQTNDRRACDLFTEKDVTLFFIGDSLVRHVAQAVGIILSGA